MNIWPAAIAAGVMAGMLLFIAWGLSSGQPCETSCYGLFGAVHEGLAGVSLLVVL